MESGQICIAYEGYIKQNIIFELKIRIGPVKNFKLKFFLKTK